MRTLKVFFVYPFVYLFSSFKQEPYQAQPSFGRAQTDDIGKMFQFS